MSDTRNEHVAETVVGAVVVAVAAAFLTFALGQAGQSRSAHGYVLNAQFDRVNGIGVGSDVRVAGVKVGAVSAVRLDPTTYLAEVALTIDPGVQVPEDSSVRVSSDGLLGGAFVSIEPGISEVKMSTGATFTDAQGSVDLLTVLASFARSAGANEGANAAP